MRGCDEELCPNWSGDGMVCPCALFDLERPQRFAVKWFVGFGWKVMADGEPIGDEAGPWWPTRKHALAEAERRNAAAASL